MRCRAVATVLLLALAACQPVPQPFAHDGAPDTRLLGLPDSGGIVVLPIEDAPPVTSAALTAALANALQKANVPANTRGGNRASAWLHGRVVDDGRNARVEWELATADGRSLGTVSRSIEGTPVADWAAGEPRLMAAIAGNAAPAIAALVQEQAPGEVRVPAVYVQPVEGALGDGSPRLRAAMRTALATRLVQTAEVPDNSTLVLAGRAEVGPATGTPPLRRLRLVWTVFDPYGIEVGKIEQQNEVAAAALETGWSAIAAEVARDASIGIARMLRGIDWRAGFAGAAEQSRERHADPVRPGSPAFGGLNRPGRASAPSDVEDRLREELDR